MLLIGAKIQEYRKTAGLSQEEFAAKVGVTRQAVSKWELDKAYPDLDKLVDICQIFHVNITELIYGDGFVLETDYGNGSTPEDVSGGGSESEEGTGKGAVKMNLMAAGKVRGRSVSIRLCCIAALLGGLFVFCGVVFAAALFHYSWKKDAELVERARVERVYQQYTKADICFYDDASRKVLKTVWLDVDGIREGDFIECYTDENQRGIYVDYHMRTLVMLAVFTGGLLVLFLLCMTEIRRFAKENRWHVLVDETKEKEQS